MNLKIQLDLLATQFKQCGNSSPTFHDIKDYLVSLSPAARTLMSEVCTVLKLVLVMPATNAVSERSASALRRIKMYLRTTMQQARLNSLMILHVHKERTDTLSIELCMNEFVARREHRLALFGTFSYEIDDCV